MKQLFKRLFKSAVMRFVLVWLAANFIRLVFYTNRKRIMMAESAKPYLCGDKQAVFAFWHGRMMMMPMMCPPQRKMHVVISSHRDGEMIARTMHRFGFGTVRGSTSRGAVSAGKGAVKVLQEGDNVSFTPDGPRGPAMKVQPGATTVAQMAGVPVVPITFAASRHKRARSWDSFMVALPLGTLYFVVGPAMHNATPEVLEQVMVDITQEADRHVFSVS